MTIHNPATGGYYGLERHDALALLPAGRVFSRVLEIGCGRGNTLGFLRDSGRALHVTGLEYAPCQEARHPSVDQFITGDAKAASLPPGPFDLILLLDVLEHLRAPYALLRKVEAILETDGRIVISVPNVRFFRLVMKLLVHGKWDYENAGILDRTHLHFFTDASFRMNLRHNFPELRVLAASRNYGNQHRFADRCLRVFCPDLVTVQNLYCLGRNGHAVV